MPRVDFPLGPAVVTKPVAYRNFLEANTVGMVQLVTVITVHQHIIIVILLTDLAWLAVIDIINRFQQH